MKFLKIQLPDESRDYGLLIIRLAAGFFMIYGHGYGKLTRLFGPDEISFADPFGLGPVITLTFAVFAEFFCAILVMIGLFTRAALIPLIITMATAFFFVHLTDDFGSQEKSLLYLFIFIGLFFTGPGRISIDKS